MYASVSKMVRKATGEVVAVKRMKKRLFFLFFLCETR